MKLKFLGGAGQVTGSKTLVETEGRKFLVDCGLFQGLKALRLQNWEPLPLRAADIEAVLLTHAHIDHSGYLPRLYRDGFRGAVYATPATVDLCRILLLDSAKLMDEEARYANKKGFSRHKPALPLFTVEDVQGVLGLFSPVEFGARLTLGGRDGLVFRRAGHILGAASIHADFDGARVTFSGDVGRLRDPIMPPPEPLDETDLLVIESTYGDRRHSQKDPVERLEEAIARMEVKGGSLLIPSFAVGRAQQLLYYLVKLDERGGVPPLPIYLDSPMAREATEVFLAHPGDHKLSPAECERMISRVRIVADLDESRAVQADPERKIVISASGMATGGRVLHYMKKMAPDPRNTILFAGYQAVGTRGAQLVAGAREVKIHGEYVSVAAEVDSLENVSAHADAAELLEWLAMNPRLNPRWTFVAHGEPAAAEALRLRLRDHLGWNGRAPAQGDEFEFINLKRGV